MSGQSEGWAVWFVGIPGSGKSSLARTVHARLLERGVDVVHLEMDERRKSYFPHPKYTPEERRNAYELFVNEASELVREGRGVLMDGSAYRVAMRNQARERISRFAEVFVHCELEEAIRRETLRPAGKVMAGMYRKALIRRQTGEQFEGLGDVIGIDVEFERDECAELVIDNTLLSLAEAVGKTLHFLDSWLANA